MQDLDHILYMSPDLERGMDEIEDLLGIRPVLGGRHPGYGTHNALLALDGHRYLEVIAPDSSQFPPGRGVVFGLDRLESSRLGTWVLRTDSLESLAGAAADAGFDLGPISAGSRENPDGRVLEWRVTDPYAMLCDGAVPFLIDWGETPHPSTIAPRAGDLLDLRVEHPRSEDVRRVYSALGVDLVVSPAPAYRLVARIESARGVVELS